MYKYHRIPIEKGTKHGLLFGNNLFGNIINKLLSAPQTPNKSIYPHQFVGPGGKLYG